MGANNKLLELLPLPLLADLKLISMLDRLYLASMDWLYHYDGLFGNGNWGATTVKKYHTYSRQFSNCFQCCCTDNCFMHKLGAQACTIKHKVMKGEL